MQRFFDDQFIDRIKSEIPEELKNSIWLRRIFFEMEGIRCDSKGNNINGINRNDSGQINDHYNYDNLFALMDKPFAAVLEYQINAHQNYFKKLKNEIVQYVNNKWPKYSANLKKTLREEQDDIREEECFKKSTACGIVTCSIWSIVQQPLTLFNLCGMKRIPLERGEIHLCDSLNSINSLCADYSDHQERINNLSRSAAKQHVAISKQLEQNDEKSYGSINDDSYGPAQQRM